jgi:hypothetical protein
VERWGHCDACARWFYMPTESTRCPVCQEQPARVEERAPDDDSGEAGED